MSDVRLYVHAVWAVKNRAPLLNLEKHERLFHHIQAYTVVKHIELLALNGHVDHLHALIRLQATQSIGQVMRLIKGQSAWWANKERIFERDLNWAVGYYARSVEPKRLKVVKNYISNQDKHHTSVEVMKYLGQIEKPENEMI
jgi:putative transposase